jgi:putative flavoprotein involved in K+ transport
METSRHGHTTWMSGPKTGAIPFRPESFLGRNIFGPLLLGFVFHHVLTVKTPMGRKARQGAVAGSAPLIRVKERDLAAAGVRRVPRVVDARNGRPVLEDGSALDVANVIWCTGFDAGFDWIDRPIFDAHAMPKHDSGVAANESGLYFVGLPFLYSMSSAMIHGVSRDAERIVSVIASRCR